MSSGDRRPDSGTGHISEAIWFALVLLVAAFLRAYQLNGQMWLDEFSAILQTIRRPWFEIVTVWPGSATHVLYEVLANWSSSLFGESAFSVRLPAAVFGVAGVAVLGGIGRKIQSARLGLYIAALMAVSYHHIFFSQNARGYTALIFFFLLSSYLFMNIAGSRSIGWKMGSLYCLVTVLTCYSQPFGVFIPAAHFLVAVALGMRGSVNGSRFPFREYLAWLVAAGFMTLLVYAPFFDGMIGHATMNIETPEEGPRFDIGLVIEIVEGLSAAFGGYAGFAIASLIGLVGVVVWLRINALSFFVLVLPIIVQAIVFFAMGVGIHPRYFAIAIPVIYVAGGITIFNVTLAIVGRTTDPWKKSIPPVLLAASVIVSAYPLLRYYTVPKQDFEGALELVETLASEGDVKAGIQTVASIMTRYYGKNFIRIDTHDELLSLEQGGGRIWVVMTLERIMEVADPGLVRHIRDNYKLIESLPGTVGDGSIQVYGQRD